jgi:hypothetical protein
MRFCIMDIVMISYKREKEKEKEWEKVIIRKW